MTGPQGLAGGHPSAFQRKGYDVPSRGPSRGAVWRRLKGRGMSKDGAAPDVPEGFVAALTLVRPLQADGRNDGVPKRWVGCAMPGLGDAGPER